MRKNTSPKEWNRHLAAQPLSGKTVKGYCHANGLDLSSFYRQRRKCSKNGAGGEPQAFVQAPALLPRKVSGSSLAIRVKDFNLTLEDGYSSNDLERVLIALGKVQHVFGSK